MHAPFYHKAARPCLSQKQLNLKTYLVTSSLVLLSPILYNDGKMRKHIFVRSYSGLQDLCKKVTKIGACALFAIQNECEGMRMCGFRRNFCCKDPANRCKCMFMSFEIRETSP